MQIPQVYQVAWCHFKRQEQQLFGHQFCAECDCAVVHAVFLSAAKLGWLPVCGIAGLMAASMAVSVTRTLFWALIQWRMLFAVSHALCLRPVL